MGPTRGCFHGRYAVGLEASLPLKPWAALCFHEAVRHDGLTPDGLGAEITSKVNIKGDIKKITTIVAGFICC